MRPHVDIRSAITVLTIPAIHALDPLFMCAGEPAELSAIVASLNETATIIDTGEKVRRTADDHVALSGRLEGGALVVAQIQGGSAAAIGSVLELRGTEGALRITTGQPAQFQISSLALAGAQAFRQGCMRTFPSAFGTPPPRTLRRCMPRSPGRSVESPSSPPATSLSRSPGTD
jgi:predicted dehydrogenase